MSGVLTYAPDFPYDLEWINSDRPLLLLDDLQGHVVLLHFWTSSNVNSHHSFATLGYLEQRFVDRAFVVIGVHTPKFDGERDPDHVLASVRRHGVRHPVVLDENRQMWTDYSIRAWPSFVLIDASGRLRFSGGGEPDRERMAAAVAGLLEDAAATGHEPYTTITLDEYDAPVSLRGLRFPAGIAHDPVRNLLWVADSGRQRVLALDAESGALHTAVGAGVPGAADGSLAEACFFEPRGLCVVEDCVYVADAGNHLIRSVELEEDKVETALGTGRAMVNMAGGEAGLSQPINSPWDIVGHGDQLFIAAAGVNQIWSMELESGIARPLVGSGKRGLVDGAGFDAVLAQPAGLAVKENRLAFVDADSSSVRCVDLSNGEVTTLVKGDLFSWGDEDGASPRLQYPFSVAWHGDDLMIADAYNDKIRRWRSIEGDTETLDVKVRRPEGICVADGILFISDTGNHRLLRVDLTTGEHSVMEVSGLPLGATAFATEFSKCVPVELAPGVDATLRLPMDLPARAVLQPNTSATLEVENRDGSVLVVEVTVTPDIEGANFMARGLGTNQEGSGTVRLHLVFTSCQQPGQVPHVQERRYHLPVSLVPGAERIADVVVDRGS